MIEYYLHPEIWWRYLLLCVSCLGIISSFFITRAQEFKHRWIFGFSLSFLFTFIGISLTSFQETKSTFIFKSEDNAYKARIIDSPKQKEKSILLALFLPEEDRKIVAYIETTPLSEQLEAGDEIYFYSKLAPFKSYETANNFDYAQYMHNKGFSATSYIPAQRWDFSEEKHFSLKTKALETRRLILNFYESLKLTDDEFAILSALTLGYKDALPENIVADFRASGTAHLLAISGLHVGILFFALSFLLSFIKDRKKLWLKLLLILLLLWLYVFIIGLPASAVRACIMITLFCIAQTLNRRRVAFNTLAIAAFFMLIYNPLWLFDISFQFSFSATAFIIWLQPKAERLVKTKNKSVRFLWSTFSVSLIAQMGTFPLALFYFGYFPTYFFAANLFIIPLAIGLVYIGLLFLILSPLILLFGDGILIVLIYLLKADIWLITATNSLISSLPFSQITNISINNLSLMLIYCVVLVGAMGFIRKKSQLIVFSLFCLTALLINTWHLRLADENKFSVYYGSDIRYNLHGQEYKLDTAEKEKYLNLNNTHILYLSTSTYVSLHADHKYELDYLILGGSDNFSLYELTQVFHINKVILDSSLPKRSIKKIAKECQELGISYHDIRENDAYHLFF